MMGKILYWSPRILGVLGILFISAFALDVFGTGAPLSSVLVGLFMHLLPSIFLAVLLGIAWRFEIIGGVAFLLVSCVPFVLLSNPVWVNAILAGPFFVTGLLLMLSRYASPATIPTGNV